MWSSICWKLDIKLCKCVLRVGKYATNAAVTGELGRYPMALRLILMEGQKCINAVIMDIDNSIIDIHNSIMDIRNSIMDIHDCRNIIIGIHNSIMDIHDSIIDIRNWIVDIYNSIMISIITSQLRIKQQLCVSKI